jgi:hypothetical protein
LWADPTIGQATNEHNRLAQAIAKLNKQEQATLFEAGEIIKRLVEL